MKKLVFILLSCCALYCYAQDRSFGKITIVPSVQPSDVMDNKCQQLMTTKLVKVTSAHQVSGGFDRRFVIVPRVDILDEELTSTIPQKTVLKVMFTFCIGDGISGALFNNLSIETKGVGDNHFEALYSAIRKINTEDSQFVNLIRKSETRIISYYNENIPSMLSDARNFMALQKFENAIYVLSLIPTACNQYSEVQTLITECCHAILHRNNQIYLQKAQLTWAANPNEEGAKEATLNLAKIIVTCEDEKSAITNLTDSIQKRMVELHNQEYEIQIQELAIQKAQIESSERIQIEQIQAGEKEAESFYQMLPNIVYNFAGWFF